MNKVLLAAALLASASVPALAADPFVPVAPVIVEDEGNPWEGFHIGIQGGYGWATREGCVDTEFFLGDDPQAGCTADIDDGDGMGGWNDGEFLYDQEGWLLGAQAGATMILGDVFLLGVEVDASLADIEGALTEDDWNPDGDVDEANGVGTYTYLATGTVQAGIAIDAFKIYAEGGVAIGGFQYDGADGCDFASPVSGVVAGVGAAAMVTDNVSIGAEYNHIWFDNDINNCTSNMLVDVNVDTLGEMDVIKLNANLHF